MMTLALLGNLILDQVYVVKNLTTGTSNAAQYSYVQMGGIGNLLRIIDNLDITIASSVGDDLNGQHIRNQIARYPNVRFGCLPSDQPTTAATIISDLSTNTRTSVVHWGACSKVTHNDTANADWCHILYGDKICYDIEFIKNQSNKSILSMDLCCSQHDEQTQRLIAQTLPYLDFLIISDQEYPALNTPSLLDLGKRVKGWAIVHSSHGSRITDGQQTLETTCDTVAENLDVLGAGDIFASFFIQNAVMDLPLLDNVNLSHTATTNYLISHATHTPKT